MSGADIDATVPTSPFPLLPMRHGVVFPGTAVTLPIGRPRSIALVEDLREGQVIGIGVQREPQLDNPSADELLPMGTIARVLKRVRVREGQYRLVVQGLSRFHFDGFSSTDPYWLAEGRPVEETQGDSLEAPALAELLLERVQKIQPSSSEELQRLLSTPATWENPGLVADVVAGALGLTPAKEVEVMLQLDVVARLHLVHHLIAEAQTMAELKEKIGAEVHRELNKGQREAILRQQLRAIRRELGDEEEGGALDDLAKRLGETTLPEESKKVVDRELKRLRSMDPGGAESHVARTYLELIAELPWEIRADLQTDVDKVAAKLDADHFGLTEVKKRILEHLAVRKMTGGGRGAILCLVGPPGVGKTSLGRSIADATLRPFTRISLGGMRDEAEIRGHRRTYVGALPGRIINAIRKAEVKNPVMLLDEVDKLGTSWMGSPEAALLEVLDPEQNVSFTDHYLDMPFDLSEVFFVCTANTLDSIAPPLRDRLEVIEIQGYTSEEKQHIARHHILPKALDEHGLASSAIDLDDDALARIILDHTRESGVRQLERELTKIIRGATLEIARHDDGKAQTIHVGVGDVHTYLGKQRFFNDVAERTAIPGVATGLAWTPVGGDILFIETSRMPGKGQIEITGQLGDVMRESARAALSYIRSHADTLGVDPTFLESQDLHIHVPAGAVPKDGPSAGVTIFTALASLLSDRCVRSDTAMTGECTLRGRVLPVGGIKSKVLAAHRGGLTRIILPEKNRRDLDEIPREVLDSLEIIFAEDMNQVLDAALLKQPEVPQVPAASVDNTPRLAC
ncbi:MAG: endopeptidase La [Deltaproteobacteria bacterium RIFOXYA12_FULL_58_15]|nr:MAG: endopeptidase La [Deltaproteobacteria bacterium RIFOXYA12_FULL_58_15]OGR09859.1 MAG: endopeptidase La [Deltaproteobacteria bacterium RIFOXYB12_FULL_58_9]